MKNLFPIIAVFTCVNVTLSQVQLFVKKGSLTIGQTTHQAGAVVSLKSTDKVLTSEKTKAIAKKQAQLMELEKNKTYTYKQLEKKLDAKSNFTQAFINAVTSQQVAQKNNAGATHRGDVDDPMTFYPLDSVQVLSDSILLELSPNLNLKSDIKMYRQGGTDTLRFSRENYAFWIKDLTPGTYFWEYKAKIGTANYTFKNLFYVPQAEVKLEYSKQISEYEIQLADFSEDMRALLLEEFLLLNRWVIGSKN
jgi:hypothetical protein